MDDFEPPSIWSLQPVTHALQWVAEYGWWLMAATVATLAAASVLRPRLQRWRQEREDAEYHKDPDVALQRMEAIQRARERQQRQLAAESARAVERQREREERSREEMARRAGVAGAGEGSAAGAGGSRLGSRADYLPLSGGGGGGSGYRPPKKSKCGGGGCGR